MLWAEYREPKPRQIGRNAGNGYNPKGVLQQTAKMAAEVSC